VLASFLPPLPGAGSSLCFLVSTSGSGHSGFEFLLLAKRTGFAASYPASSGGFMRKPPFAAMIWLGLSLVTHAQSPAPAPSALTVIRAGTLIDGVSEAPRKNQLIFVRGERIEKVTEGSAAIPAGAKVIDLSVRRCSRA